VTVQNRIFFTYLYLDNTTGMTHLKIEGTAYFEMKNIDCENAERVLLTGLFTNTSPTA